ncbi:MAG: hypothetical protein JWM03_1434, partial [Rhodocyclales bacterium]|nr:hypothetical protein [Rhodocyclales bacterium]
VGLASWWVSGLDDETPDKHVGQSTRNATATRKLGASGQRDPAEALAMIAKAFAPRQSIAKLQTDPFIVVSFEPPPPPPPAPPKPTAPPLNFKYLGVLNEDQELRKGAGEIRTGESTGQGAGRAVFLDSGGQMLIAHKGDTLIGQYKVLEINDTNMQLEYLPLAERQTLNFGR